MTHRNESDTTLKGSAHNPNQRSQGWQTVNTWSFKGPLLVIAVLAGFFDHALHWGRAPIAAGVAMIIPIIGFRGLWSETRFWITVVLLGVLQIPVVIAVQPVMEQFKFPYMLLFGVIDCALIISAISWVCSRMGNGE